MASTEIVVPVVGDGVADDTAAIQAAIKGAPPGSVVALPCGVTCLITASLEFTTAVGFDGHGSTIKANLPLSDSAAIVVSSVTPGSNYQGNRVPFRNFNLVGSGNSVTSPYGSTCGLLIQASNFGFDGLNISNFPNGISFGNNGYGLAIQNFQIYDCYCGVFFPYPLNNAGENIAFTQGAIFNNQIGMENDSGPNCALVFAQTSFDYNKIQIMADNGRTMLYQCHVEGIMSTPFQMTWGVNNWTSLVVRDTDVVFGSSPTSDRFPLVVNSNAEGAFAFLENCFFYGFTQDNAKPERWFTGQGVKNIRTRSCTNGWSDQTAAFNFPDFN